MNSFVQLTDTVDGAKKFINMNTVQQVIADLDARGSMLWLDGCLQSIKVQESPEAIMELFNIAMARQSTEAALKWGSNSGMFELIRQVGRRL